MTLSQAGTLYYLAVHSDLASLREGITFVVDTTKSPAKPVGNERKLQKTWQSYPLRPQNLFIVGHFLYLPLYCKPLSVFLSIVRHVGVQLLARSFSFSRSLSLTAQDGNLWCKELTQWCLCVRGARSQPNGVCVLVANPMVSVCSWRKELT